MCLRVSKGFCILLLLIVSCGPGLFNYDQSGSNSATSSSSPTTFVADFSSFSQWDTTAGDTGLWDTVDQRIQAAVSANSVVDINFGDGSDGAFNNGPTQTGITVSGNSITLDTDTKATFNFSSFNLSNGFTLKATGSQPLTIRVLGTGTIAGTIDVSGGSSAVGTSNNSTDVAALGGTGVASGGAGGAAGFGGSPGTSSTSGSPSTGSNVLGGAFGGNTSVSASDAGGGGGCNGVHGAAPDAVGNDAQAASAGGAAGACTTTRSSVAAAFESSFTGGAGGGGGGNYAPGASDVSGAGGGAGGGAVHLTSLGSISFGTSPNTGNILANGGAGGDGVNVSGGSDCGGAGGGGSGGSIWLQTKGTIANSSNQGSVNVSGGSGGSVDAVSCAPFGAAGNGSLGIVRVDATSASTTGTSVVFTNVPTVRSGQSFVVTSKAIDTGLSNPSFNTPTETQDTTSSGCGTAGTLKVTYQGSSNGTSFGTGVSGAQISSLNGKRYVRFQVTITSTGSTPPCLSGLSFSYD